MAFSNYNSYVGTCSLVESNLRLKPYSNLTAVPKTSISSAPVITVAVVNLIAIIPLQNLLSCLPQESWRFPLEVPQFAL